MMTDQFEAAFGAFLDSADYDTALEHQQECLFTIARTAFSAGWQAALAQKDSFGTEPVQEE